MNEEQKQAVYDCVRETLWIAKCWNDHNFKPELILEKSKKVADALGVLNIEQGNVFLDDLKKQLEK